MNTQTIIQRLQRENALLRAILRDRCFCTVYRREFSRKGYSLLVEPETALRDIEYRDAPLHATPDEAIDAAIEYYRNPFGALLVWREGPPPPTGEPGEEALL